MKKIVTIILMLFICSSDSDGTEFEAFAEDLSVDEFLICSVPLGLCTEDGITVNDLLQDEYCGIYRSKGKSEKHQELFAELNRILTAGDSTELLIYNPRLILIWKQTDGRRFLFTVGTGRGPFEGTLSHDYQTNEASQKAISLVFDLLPKEIAKVWEMAIIRQRK